MPANIDNIISLTPVYDQLMSSPSNVLPWNVEVETS